jgi:hypothetical protein
MPKQTSANVEPSLEVDFDAIEAIAEDVDNRAAAKKIIRKGKRIAKPKAEPVASETTSEATPAPVEETDPEFIAMLTHGTSQAIDLMRDKMELMEPGDTLRENVGKCVARLLTRIKPMQAGPISDAVQIAGYLGVWIIAGKDWSKKAEVTASPNN